MDGLSAEKTQPALLLTVEQVAELLNCSVRHIWRLTDSGVLPKPMPLGSKLKRWPRTAIEQFIREGHQAHHSVATSNRDELKGLS